MLVLYRMFVYLFASLSIIELHEEVRETELLLQAKIKERDVLKGFKVNTTFSLSL